MASNDVPWLKELIVPLLSEKKPHDVRPEMMMVFLEGLIVRSEFQGSEANRQDYREVWLKLAGVTP
ncbi:hypothetical protein VCRA2111O136_130086 [Vibrio crassostreae]|uniref:hypothetical protein n=1 Tax=Vibrio crassostreae TaxID=246167 RepID=UPI001B3104C1|nr:hypothetical protein [Vibrio crassostreae]CAK2412066.1 hypothetical protein VCRA2111O136_130086 [Vibrio crassostreae]CAK3169652.1 hypothetical protein VCRA217O134_90081 [Vibrio crassostreae]CAK3338034.1 hypothetical protein VCRA2123E76_10517 [Vibrio crassostreae]